MASELIKVTIDQYETIKEYLNQQIEFTRNCPSNKNLMNNVDLIGEEENFNPHRTIDIEHRQFHGKLKTTAYMAGMEDLYRTILDMFTTD